MIDILQKVYNFIGDDALFALISHIGISDKTYKTAYKICPERLKDRLIDSIICMLPLHLQIKIQISKLKINREEFVKLVCLVKQENIIKILMSMVDIKNEK